MNALPGHILARLSSWGAPDTPSFFPLPHFSSPAVRNALSTLCLPLSPFSNCFLQGALLVPSCLNDVQAGVPTVPGACGSPCLFVLMGLCSLMAGATPLSLSRAGLEQAATDTGCPEHLCQSRFAKCRSHHGGILHSTASAQRPHFTANEVPLWARAHRVPRSYQWPIILKQ